MNRDTIYSQFLNLEVKYNLFDLSVDDIQVWERIRLNTFRQILYKCGIINEAHDDLKYTPQTYLQALTTLVQSGIQTNPLLANHHDFFFFGHPRRQVENDGYWWDIYCDPIYSEVDLNYVHMSANVKLNDYTPRKTTNYRNLDFVRILANVFRNTRSLEPNLPPDVCQTLQSFSAELNDQLGVNVNLRQIVAEKLTERASLKPFYDRILDRVDPAVAVMVVSYENNTFIEACHDQDIPVVELQHGVINKYHLGYSYPEPRRKEVFPDYFFIWGKKWQEMAELPLSSEAIIPVGYPYLEQQASKIKNRDSEETIIFISQGTIGEKLSQLAAEFANQNPTLDVVYKLHPGEYDRWETAYPWLTDAPVVVIDSNDPPLYELLTQASYQVGVYSTALYEGLFFGTETYIADLYGADRMEGLLQQGDATLVSTASELTIAVESNTDVGDFDAMGYFEPNATDKIRTQLQQILSKRLQLGYEE